MNEIEIWWMWSKWPQLCRSYDSWFAAASTAQFIDSVFTSAFLQSFTAFGVGGIDEGHFTIFLTWCVALAPGTSWTRPVHVRRGTSRAWVSRLSPITKLDSRRWAAPKLMGWTSPAAAAAAASSIKAVQQVLPMWRIRLCNKLLLPRGSQLLAHGKQLM